VVAVNHQRLIQGEGTPESRWQPWLQSSGIRTCSIEAVLPRSARLVIIAPHPDDEVLACGGLMAMYRALGGDVLVIAVTDGEASHVGSPKLITQSLAATRSAEAVDGLNQLGLHGVPVIRLAIPDGLVAHHTLRLALRLQMLLRPTDVVVSTWRLDGHPDHDATGFAASLACAAVGCRLIEAPVWMWHWAAPGDSRVPWQRLWRLPLESYVRDRKRAALSAHVSQLDESRHANGAVLGASIVQRANRLDEYFFATEEQPHEAHLRLL
jgi:LmbE family N-acetylglucosaminyl deacetylase